jgi:hypothetical protein
VGQPAAGVSHHHSGGSIGRQIGYSVPPWQGLHRQRTPSPYQHDSVGSEHFVVLAGGGMRHEGGNGGVLQVVLAGVTTHFASTQRAEVRHSGRGSSPQLQCASTGNGEPESHGGVHELPGDGGARGHAPCPEPPLPAFPPVPPLPAVPPLLVVPPTVVPLPAAPPLPAVPPLVVSPPQAWQSQATPDITRVEAVSTSRIITEYYHCTTDRVFDIAPRWTFHTARPRIATIVSRR